MSSATQLRSSHNYRQSRAVPSRASTRARAGRPAGCTAADASAPTTHGGSAPRSTPRQWSGAIRWHSGLWQRCPSSRASASASTPCMTAYANRWAMITRPGAYQNRPWPPPSVRSQPRSDGHRPGPPQALTTRTGGDLRPVAREQPPDPRSLPRPPEAGVSPTDVPHPLPRSRPTASAAPSSRKSPLGSPSRLANRSSRVDLPHGDLSPHTTPRPRRGTAPRPRQLPQRLTGALLVSATAASRLPIATMTCSARSITRRSPLLALLAPLLGHLPRVRRSCCLIVC